MSQRFVACDRAQSFLMPPDVREWLPPRHLAWVVIDAVAELNLDAFYAAYRVDGRSRPAYDPAMMVALLLYAYARGIRSSRVIERACEEDVDVEADVVRCPVAAELLTLVESSPTRLERSRS
jgi:transposase